MSSLEREVSIAMHLAAGIISMSALLGIVIYTVQIGNDVKGYAIEQANQIEYDLKTYSLDQLVDKNTILPAAAAYALVEKNYSVISEYKCEICNSTEVCLNNHLTGKVSLEINKASEETYKVTIHKENCNWDTGVCTD